MRYKNWDVLLFPGQSKIPQQEFKTSCHVVQDLETRSFHSKPSLLPTVTCFIPSLDAGKDFRISIHSWEKPEASRHILSLRRPLENFSFETRLFVDGKESGSKRYNQNGPWPTLIETMVDGNGQLKPLEFPVFHQELLSQSYWSPVDDLGRLKIIIAEGFIRDDNNHSFERIRNIISFSFQHAPLALLESSSIAWPNSFMWQHVSPVEIDYSRSCSPRIIGIATDTSEDGGGSQSSGPLKTNSTWSEYEGIDLTPKLSRHGEQEESNALIEPETAAFRSWHEGTIDLVMLDYFRSDTYNRTMTVPQIDEALSTEGRFEAICEDLLTDTPLGKGQDEESLMATQNEASTSSKVMITDFEDHNCLAIDSSTFPILDSNIFEMPKMGANRSEVSENLIGVKLKSARSDTMGSSSSNETQSLPMTNYPNFPRSWNLPTNSGKKESG